MGGMFDVKINIIFDYHYEEEAERYARSLEYLRHYILNKPQFFLSAVLNFHNQVIFDS
ncbi:MAG: hypothetical protein K0S18_408 [Anaerocolumna sp.]|nr:hypothetical protein [Anaerocolumna sp.]